MTATALRQLVETQLVGVTTRAEFSKHAVEWTEFPHAEGKVVLHQNYQCLGPYGDGQPIDLTGLVAIWYGPGDTRFQQASRVLLPEDAGNVDDILAALRSEAMAKCQHTNSRHVRATGVCLNRWRCADCGHEYDVDSSD